MIDLFLVLVILFVAFGTGILSATVGVGGGFLMVSFMIAYLGLRTQTAVGTSAFVIVFSAISASVAYFRQKRIDYKIGASAAIFSIPAAFLGAITANLLASSLLAILFVIALLVVGTRMILFPRERSKDVGPRDEKKPIEVVDKQKAHPLSESSHLRWKREIVDAAGHRFIYQSNLLPALPLFFLAGFLSGLFGIGGGIVIVPALEIIADLPMHLAVATSMFTMIFTSISSAATHYLNGNVVLDYAIFLIVGIVIGAQLGALVARRLKSSALERLFGVTMLLIAVYLLLTRVLFA
jgi:uncharacterized membrane protein YfcA